ncbi:MAG TPA: hypothetical protein VFS97_12780 [Nitrososphaeraceae archaeon]|nr:hypothetical protein [Nitrososphaeraceae archaeon]
MQNSNKCKSCNLTIHPNFVGYHTCGYANCPVCGPRHIALTIIVVGVALSLVTAIHFANVSYSSEHLFSKTYVMCKEKVLGYERIGAYDTMEKFKAAFSYC